MTAMRTGKTRPRPSHRKRPGKVAIAAGIAVAGVALAWATAARARQAARNFANAKAEELANTPVHVPEPG